MYKMTPQISIHQIHKSFGHKLLFKDLSLGIHARQRIALLGPNGAGKSTLLKILCGQESVDAGEVTTSSGLRVAYVAQDDQYDSQSVFDIATQILGSGGMDPSEAVVQASIFLTQAGFSDLQINASTLSGGWRKRLSLAIALAKNSDILLLDEPTNHLDWDGILWLESQLSTFRKTLVAISHDREFLKNQCHEFIEINAAYPKGYFGQKGSYEKFLEQKQIFLAGEQSRQNSLSNKVRRETEWLRAGVKARTTKSVSRSQQAHELIDELSELKSRNQSMHRHTKIEVEHAGKQSKQFYNLENLNIFWGEHFIVRDLNLRLGPKQSMGLLGANASGKTSLIRVLTQNADNFTGSLGIADELKVIYFDQKRESLQQASTPMDFLGEGSDHINFRGQSVHINSYASRFLFSHEQMGQPIEKLSGGERARLLIAKLLTQSADVLVLDEPTNDLDLNTIEILEQSLVQFPGLVILVSHDRYFLRQVCQSFLALDGQGGWTTYADLDQWLSKASHPDKQKLDKKKKTHSAPTSPKAKLTYKEKRAMETIEEDIAKAESLLKEAQTAVNGNQDFSDHTKTQKLLSNLDAAQKKVDDLYSLWQQIEEKQQ
jgi:ABC transport system ATP-binding/permease protein